MATRDIYLTECPNPAATSHQDIHDQVQPAQPDTGREVLRQLLSQVKGIDTDLAALTDSIDQLQGAWKAQSTDLGIQAIYALRGYVEEIREHADDLHVGFGGYLDQLGTTKAQMPAPVDRSAGTDTPLTGGFIAIRNEIEHQIRTAQARQLYADAYQAAVAADFATPAFDRPPPRTVTLSSSTDPSPLNPGETDGSTAWPTPPATPTPPTEPAPPGSPPTVPNPPAPGSPGSPATPVLPAPTPPGGAGGGGSPSPVSPIPVSPSGPGGGGSTPAPAAPLAPGPAGPPAGGAATGRDTGTGLPGPGGRSGISSGRPPLVTTSESPLARGQTVAGGRPGGGMAPMGAGAGQRGDEDKEHKRPSWLVADDPNELVGELDKVAPPVIGESRGRS